MTSRLYRASDLMDVGNTIIWHGKEMKNSAVVPHIVSKRIEFNFSDIGDEPVDALRNAPQPSSVRVDGGLRDIKDSYVLVSAGEKVIDQCGFTATDVDDRSRATNSRLLYQSERGFKVRTVPADCVAGFLCVDFFPMDLCFHTRHHPCIGRLSLMIGPSQTRCR